MNFRDQLFRFDRFAIFDIDGTLSDPSHRIHHAQAKEWDKFNELCSEDLVFTKVMDLIRSISNSTNIILLTGRIEKVRLITLHWLANCNVLEHIDYIIMRPEGDYRNDYEFKLEAIEQFFIDKETALKKIWFAVDDRDQVVEAFRNYGLTVFQPAPGAF